MQIITVLKVYINLTKLKSQKGYFPARTKEEGKKTDMKGLTYN